MSQNFKMCKTSMLQEWIVVHVRENCHSLGNTCKPLFPHKDQMRESSGNSLVLRKLANKTRKTCKTLYVTLQSMIALNDR